MKLQKIWSRTLNKLSAKQRDTKTKEAKLPPFSKDTWPLYLATSLQTLKSLFYYTIGFILILGAFGFGLLGGYFGSIIDKTPIPSKTTMTRTLTNLSQSTKLMYEDGSSIGNVRTDLVRTPVSIKRMSPWLTKAIVATEDEDFYEHNGVAPKAVLRAVFSELTGIGNQTGGSTLTQQVVKMQFLSNETTFKRKAIEIMYAQRLSKYFTKEQILETYLNLAPLGRNNKGQNIAGVQTAAQGLFGKNAADLNLAEAAFIAGLPQSPSIYTPYTNTGAFKPDYSAGIKRQQTVLFRMYRAGTITEKEYQQAKAFDLKNAFLKQEAIKTTQQSTYLYNFVTEQAEDVIVEQLAKDDGYSKADLEENETLHASYAKTAAQLLSTKGYQVYTTINKDVYNAMQETTKTAKAGFGYTYSTTYVNPQTGVPQQIEQPVQAGAVLLNNQTGAIIGFVGGTSGEVNHILTTRSPGSSIKPLLVYGPAIEEKVIGTNSMISGFKTDFSGYEPSDYGGMVQNKFMTAREALEMSYNVPAVNLYSELRKKTDGKSYMDKMGVTTLTDDDYTHLGLALGGAQYGMTVKDNASAFSTFANGGEHVPAYVIEKIVSPTGKVIYQHEVEKTRVFSEATSYIMQDMLHGVFTRGTGTAVSSAAKFDTKNAYGKTGTSNDFKDVWLSGSTPGITLTTWMGYDNDYGTKHNLTESASVTNQLYWTKLANAAYAYIPETFDTGNKMKRPSTVKTVYVNTYTGTRAGTITSGNQTMNVPTATVPSLYNDVNGGAPTANFAIGASQQDYLMFWQYVNGYRNGYGVPTTIERAPTSAFTPRYSAPAPNRSENNQQESSKSNNQQRDNRSTSSSSGENHNANNNNRQEDTRTSKSNSTRR